MDRRFELVGGHPALDFANTLEGSRTGERRETLLSYADLAAWATEGAGLSPDLCGDLLAEASRRPADAARVLDRALAVREALYRVLAARLRGRAAEEADLAAVNDELSPALGRSRLAPAGRVFAWNHGADARRLDAPLETVVRSAAALLTSPDLERVRACASATCSWLFLDLSRNGSRRWCDMRVCGNRAKARAHRARSARSRR